MPIGNKKQTENFIVDTNEISQTLIQNKFGAKHVVTKNVTAGKYLLVGRGDGPDRFRRDLRGFVLRASNQSQRKILKQLKRLAPEVIPLFRRDGR